MSENIITWNVTNWITVVLMCAVGFMIVGAVGQFLAPPASEPQAA